MIKGKIWSKEETMVAFYVYCMVPFAKSSKTHPVIISYAKLLGRTPSALNMKIGNMGRLDPELKKKSITGLTHGSKMEEYVWEEFEKSRDDFVFKTEKIIEELSGKSIECTYLDVDEMNYSSDDKVRLVKTRVNQNFFRSAVLSAYNHTCAITGIKIFDLLVASHIVPWAKDKENRLNPHNGICLNSIHDKAFDKGYITINKNNRLVISNKLKEFYSNAFIKDAFKKYEGHRIMVPDKFEPSTKFLEYHNDVVFLG